MAASKQASVVVAQYDNPRYDSDNPDKEPEHIYRVVKTINTLRVKVDEKLTPAQVQQLIDNDVHLTVQSPKY